MLRVWKLKRTQHYVSTAKGSPRQHNINTWLMLVLQTDDDDSDEEGSRARCRKLPAVWQLLKDNVLGHRRRKVQDEDDIMICHCKPVWRGGDGCGPDCINRMLCIECFSVSLV